MNHIDIGILADAMQEISEDEEGPVAVVANAVREILVHLDDTAPRPGFTNLDKL